MEVLAKVPLGELMRQPVSSLDPKDHKDEMFNYYSIPAYDEGKPIKELGEEIGSSKKVLEQDDVLISRIVPHIRRVWIVGENERHTNIGSSEWIVFNTDKVIPEYLRYFLLSDVFHNQFMKTITGVGGSLMRANKKQTEKIKIPICSIKDQKAIVTKLDRAQRLIDIDKEMLAKYDELIQSVFLEMFGDVFSDKTKTPFEDHLEIKHGYAFKSKWFEDKGDVPVVKIGTVNKSTVDFSEVQFLDESYAEEYERFKVYPGDLLLSMTGTVGKDDYANPCIMTNDHDFYLLNQRVVKLNYDEKVFTKSFLYHFFKQDHVKRELTKFSRGIRQANLSNKDIYGLSFQKPDFEKQLQFEVLCDTVEKEKKSLIKSTKKAEELFSSLVQGAFG